MYKMFCDDNPRAIMKVILNLVNILDMRVRKIKLSNDSPSCTKDYHQYMVVGCVEWEGDGTVQLISDRRPVDNSVQLNSCYLRTWVCVGVRGRCCSLADPVRTAMNGPPLFPTSHYQQLCRTRQWTLLYRQVPFPNSTFALTTTATTLNNIYINLYL